MYSIFADGVCVYNDATPLEDFKVLSPELTLKDNCAGSLTFTLPANNTRYDSIKRLTTDISVRRGNKEIWAGRIIEDKEDFYKNRKIYCEGELAYFTDSIQPPAEYHDMTVRGMLETFVSIHNQQVPANRRFTVGAVTVTDPNDSLYRYTNYEHTIECLLNKLVDVLGGHLVIRKENGIRYLDYLEDYPNVSTQQISFGNNLIDFTKNYDMTDFVTCIIPRGEQINGDDYSAENTYKIGDYAYNNGYVYRCIGNIVNPESWTSSHWKKVQKYYQSLTPYLTVEEVNNGSKFVEDSEAVRNYGRITTIVDWDDVTEPANLLTKARGYLSNIQFDSMVLTITAVDLHYMNVDTEAINILDKVRVISTPHGLNKLFPITELKIPLDSPEKAEFTMGDDNKKESFSSSVKKANEEILDKIENLPSPSKILESAKNNATSLINMATNGYVTLIKNQNGTSELLITDEADWTRATKIWRWNVNGLGYSKDGGRTYGLAMTMDGSIVADFVTAGTMLADRVKGGTFEIGGSGLGKDGKILVKNAQGKVLITIDKNGINFGSDSIVGGIDYDDIDNVPKTIKSTTQLFYSASDTTFPARPTSKVTNADSSLYNTWITKIPDYSHYSNYYRIFTCVQYLYTDGTYGWGQPMEYSFKAGTTKITKDTVTTAYVNALGVTAKLLSTKDLVATGVSKIGGFTINDKHIAGYNNGNYANSTIYCEFHNWNPTYGGNTTAFGIWKRNSTSENYKTKFAINYDGNVVSATTIDFYPQDSNYGMHIHGAAAIDGKLHMNGGIIEGCGYITATNNIYTGGNLSGGVTDGRAGLNCTGGGLYVAGNAYVAGGLGCGGTKPRIVHTKTYGYRAMNAYETPTPYFGDIGEGKLNDDGECIIYIDDIFAECVNLDVKYQVFLQKYGQGDIWVEERNPSYFVVKGAPNIAFGWELKAVQLHYEDVRLDTPDDKMLATIMEAQAQEGI